MIETRRLYLRGIDETDARIIAGWRGDPNVYCFFKSPHRITLEEHLDWYHNIYLIDENRIDWMCFEKNSRKETGVFGICRKGKKTEINYLLSPESQHKGYAEEAVRKIMEYAGALWEGNTIVAEIHKNNSASIKLIEKIGFVRTSYNKPFVIYSFGS